MSKVWPLRAQPSSPRIQTPSQTFNSKQIDKQKTCRHWRYYNRFCDGIRYLVEERSCTSALNAKWLLPGLWRRSCNEVVVYMKNSRLLVTLGPVAAARAAESGSGAPSAPRSSCTISTYSIFGFRSGTSVSLKAVPHRKRSPVVYEAKIRFWYIALQYSLTDCQATACSRISWRT